MYRNTKSYQFYLLIWVVCDLFCQVLSEYCGNEKHCYSPYKCCTDKIACCYDYDQSYTRGFRLHVWNMWYFWLVIIFILMSCFGGCGYYRRRRMAALQQTVVTSPVGRRIARNPLQRRHTPDSAQHTALYAYTGPGADVMHSAQLPPPYAEVIQQPNMYPVNKVELPPYPGPPAQKGDASRADDDEVSPPPYCEVAIPPAAVGGGSAVASTHMSVPMESGSQATPLSHSDARNTATTSQS